MGVVYWVWVWRLSDFKRIVFENDIAMKIIKTAALLFLQMNIGSLMLSAQTTAEIANGSPKGIFVITGMKVVSKANPVENIVGYRIERRKGETGSWSVLAQVSGPEKQSDFEIRLKTWCNRLPEWADYNKIPAADLFKKLVKTGRIDSLKIWGQLLPVRLSAGTMYLDSTIKDTLFYQYRISAILTTGDPKPLYISGLIRKDNKTNYGKLTLVNRLVTDRDVTLIWKQDPGYKPVFYRVFRKGENQPVFSRLSPVVVRYSRGDTAFIMINDTLVTKGKVFSYYIEPVDYYGKTGKSSGAVRTGIYNFGSIRPPQNILTEPVLPAGGIRLGWKFDQPREIQSLLVFKSTNYDTGFVLVKKIAPSDTTYTDQAVEPMKKYFYYLVMEGHFGEESEPGVRVFGIAENRVTPQAPDIVKIEGVKNGARLEIALFNPDIKGVRIYRKLKNQAEFTLVSALIEYAGKPVVFTDTSRGYNGYTWLSYTVQAENSSYALSPFSDTLSVYPLSESLPTAPDNLALTIDQGRVHMLWDDIAGVNPNVLGYRVYRRRLQADVKTQSALELLSSTFLKPERNYFTDSLVAEGNTYEYQVKSVDFYSKESKAGPVARITIPKEKAVAPSGMKLIVSDEGVLIEWEEPVLEGVLSYKLYRYQRGGKPAALATLNPGTAKFTDKTVKKGQLYFYYLTSMLKNGIESNPGREEGVWR
jgi:hypothetical protein